VKEHVSPRSAFTTGFQCRIGNVMMQQSAVAATRLRREMRFDD
jgi:hypothetical protein